MADEKLVLSTTGSREVAARIANTLVQERLAACVNIIGPIDSFFRWKENVEQEQEFLLLIKTVAAKSPAVLRRIGELHSYELPEGIELNISGGEARYLKWIADST